MNVLWIHSVLLLLCISHVNSNANVDSVELESLQDLYESTKGEYWAWDTSSTAGAVWNFSVAQPNPCFPIWQGLTCLCTNMTNECIITEIGLDGYNLTGPIPNSIVELSALNSLSLSSNFINGTIPVLIGDLEFLERLDLHNNSLSGYIPTSIGSLEYLSLLDVSLNLLSGSLPDQLWNLGLITSLNLFGNHLTGTISESIGNLTALLTIDLSDNKFMGRLPQSLGSVTSLLSVFVSDNELIGTIPDSFCTLKHLQDLYLPGNDLSGSIPDCIGEMKGLVNLALFENSLNGTLPVSLVTLVSNLSALVLGANYFSGSVPMGMFNMTESNLIRIYLDDNRFTGPLPEISLRRLLAVEFSSNYFTGSITSFVCNSTDLLFYSAADNDVGGTIPVCFGELKHLSALVLSSNHISGSMFEFTELQVTLTQFQVDVNQITGSIPSSLCINMPLYLDVGNNLLHGVIPDCGVASGKLIYFSVSDNLLSGDIPVFLVNEWNINTITIDGNLLTGTLPLFNCSRNLIYLYVHSNHFHGPITLNSNYSSLEYVDLSNNQFTGSFPVDLFKPVVPLVSFIASSNCISGTIPDEICSLTSLVFLNLNGLSTASVCRTAIFPHFESSKSFTLPNRIDGSIPVCLFGMEKLQTLQLSGNSIQWSFPTDNSLVIGENLNVLSLSHNKLTGTIPMEIQKRQWSTIDLSFNKLVGAVHFVEQNAANASLVLQVNRLSGGVPSSLIHLQSINILNGNLFGCKLHGRSSLPTHDTSYETYECGSNMFDIATIAWVVIAGSVAICLVVPWLVSRQEYSGLFKYYLASLDKVLLYVSFVYGASMAHFFGSMIILRNSVLILTLGLVVVFLPLYATLKSFYNTAHYQYAWTVSAAFLSGVPPAVILWFVYLSLLVGLVIGWNRWGSIQMVWKEVVTSKPESQGTLSGWVVLILAVMANCIVMITINALYVAIILNFNSSVVLVTQFALALFKLVWNDLAATRLVSFSRQEGVVNLSTEMPFMTCIILFNSIVAPCLATAAVDSNCFYTVFRAAQPVSSEFPYFSVEGFCRYVIADLTGKIVCYIQNVQTDIEVSYDPPYIYSYQCSSSMLTNYASVYVFMFLFVAFVKPVMLYASQYCFSGLLKGSCLHAALEITMYRLLKPADVKDLTTKKVIFHKDKFVFRLIAKVAILLTFGVIFPPIAVVACVAFVVEIYVSLIMVGRFLALIPDEETRMQFRELLKRDCQGCVELLLDPVMKLVLPFAAIFYSFFVFDIYGDAVGFRAAVWAPVVLSSALPVLWVVKKAVEYLRRNGKEDSRQETEGVVVGTEMPIMNVLQEKSTSAV